MQATDFEIRRMRDDELEEVIALWARTTKVAYPYLPLEQKYTLDERREFFTKSIAPRCEIWIASHDSILGFLALAGSYLDRLYVDPDRQRSGVGAALLDKAQSLSPAGLELHTHQQNEAACAFYEKHGLRAVKFGTSPPPESAPDVEYHWRPPPG